MSLKLRHPLADYNGDQGLDLELSGQVGEHYYKLFSHSCHTGLLLSLKVQNFSSVEFSPKSKQMRKYSQSGILMQQYSQSGIKDKSLKMPVCEDFRFLALLNTYSVVKHAVLRNNFCKDRRSKSTAVWTAARLYVAHHS